MNTITLIISLEKKHFDADNSAFTEKIESTRKTRKFKVGDRVKD